MSSQKYLQLGWLINFGTVRARARQPGGSEPARGGGVSGQGLLRRGDPGILCGDKAWGTGSSPGYLGPAEEPAH